MCYYEGPCFAARKDYYGILGVSKNASREEIKKDFHAASASGLFAFTYSSADIDIRR